MAAFGNAVIGAGRKKLQDELFCVTEERNYFQQRYLEQVSEIMALKTELEHSKSEVRRLRQRLMSMDSSYLGAEGDGSKSVTPRTPANSSGRSTQHGNRNGSSSNYRRQSSCPVSGSSPGGGKQQHQELPQPRRILNESLSDLTASDYYGGAGGGCEEKKNDSNNAARALDGGDPHGDGDDVEGGGDLNGDAEHDHVALSDAEDAEADEGHDDDDVLSIRQNAAKLLQWVDYRITSLSPSKGDEEAEDDDDEKTEATGDQEVTLKDYTDSVDQEDDSDGAVVASCTFDPSASAAEINRGGSDDVDDDDDEDDRKIQTLYRKYCDKLVDIQQASSKPVKSLHSFTNGRDGGYGSPDIVNNDDDDDDGWTGDSASVGQLAEEAMSILKKMTSEVHANLSVAKTAEARRKGEEWIERISLYKGQLRIQSM